MKTIKIKGSHRDLGTIEFENMKILKWNDLIDEETLQIPFGTSVEITIAYDEHDFLSGKDGIVWGSYDPRQVDIIKNALLAQNIHTEVQSQNLNKLKIYLLIISNIKDLSDSMDFIWRSKTGLRLKPDWTYPDKAINKSFELWLSGQ